MNYFTDFLNREKIKSLDSESRLNLLNPDCDEKKLQTPDNESRLNLLNPPRDPLTPGEIPPADGLIRRGAFIKPTRETLPAFAAHFEAKNSLSETVSDTHIETDSDRQTERIRNLAATVTADELLSAHLTIKPALQKSLSKTDLHELALTLAVAQKRENRLRRDVYRPARTFHPRDVYQPEKQAKGDC